jgi:cytidylate kinase
VRIAIDGPAGSGKSTVAKALAKKRKLTYLDTGAMYRACALRAERKGIDFKDSQALAACAKEAKIEFGPFAEKTQVFLDGEDVSDAIRTAEVDRDVSVVAGIPEIRADMVARQQAFGAQGDVVAEGRDIASVVFPDAEVKVFLVANPEARAHRRAVERAGGDTAKGETVAVDPQSEEAILKDMARRDKADSSRASFKLEPAPGAVTIDSSEMTVEEVVDEISALMDKAAAKENAKPEPPPPPREGGSSCKGGSSQEEGTEEGRAHEGIPWELRGALLRASYARVPVAVARVACHLDDGCLDLDEDLLPLEDRRGREALGRLEARRQGPCPCDEPCIDARSGRRRNRTLPSRHQDPPDLEERVRREQARLLGILPLWLHPCRA